MVNIPSTVIISEPKRWVEIMVKAQLYCSLSNNVTVSEENAEKVVNPPKKPVIINNRASGGSVVLWRKYSVAIPIK